MGRAKPIPERPRWCLGAIGKLAPKVNFVGLPRQADLSLVRCRRDLGLQGSHVEEVLEQVNLDGL